MNEPRFNTTGATDYTPPPNSVLALHGIDRIYKSGPQNLEIFRGVTNQVAAGEVVALVGPSGSGKSSLLHICGLLESPTAGEVIINGRNCATLPDAERTRIRREELGFVYQFHHLLPEFSAAENIILPQLIAGHRRSDAESNAERLLTMVGLSERMTHRPSRLSGGEQQRVAIARALANQPSLILADEPTGNLDPKTADMVFRILVEICRARGVAALIATHNLQMATRMDRTWLLHEGKLIDAGKLKP
jgi:lipoprotein-releasing system ATP-binding protein